MTERLVIVEDPAAGAAIAADRIARTLTDAVAARGRADWATTGGSTPVAIYRRLSAPPLDETVPWADVHVWWGDDRFVPRDHPASNVKAFDDVMLGIGAREEGTAGADRLGVPLQVDHVHPFPTGEAIGEARGAAWCAAELAGELRAAGLDDQDGWPVFDLMFLGIGPDGHLLSVFPGSPALDSPDLALAIPAPTHIEPQIERVTLNPAVARRRPGGAGRGLRARTRPPGSRTSSARSATRAAGPASSPGARGRPGSSTRLPRPCSLADGRRPDDRAGPGHRLARRHADRASSRPATGRRSSSSTARPATTRRSVSSARCSPRRRTVHAMDRRGRGASGDTLPYAIEREFEDVAAVADALATDAGARGRRRRALVRRALGARGRAADRFDRAGGLLRGRAHATRRELPPGRASRRACASGSRPAIADGALAAFMTEVVGMSAADLAAYRADPVWPARAAAAGTILRELEAETDPAASLDRLGAVRQPVLQILGGSSLPVFRTATEALDARLGDGRIVVIDGARHAAHHTHPDAFVRAVRDFLDVPTAVR